MDKIKKNGELLLTIAILIMAFSAAVRILFTADRAGLSIIPDPLLSIIPQVELSIIISVLFYAFLLFSAFRLMKNKSEFTYSLQAVISFMVFRIMGISYIKIAPPEGGGAFIDPLLAFLGWQTQAGDLFMSSYIGIPFLLYFHFKEKVNKKAALVAGISISIFSIFQHSLYSVDVLASILAAFLGNKILDVYHKHAEEDKVEEIDSK